MSLDSIELSQWQLGFVDMGLAAEVGKPRFLTCRRARFQGKTAALSHLIKELPERIVVVACTTKRRARAMRDWYVDVCLPRVPGHTLMQKSNDCLQYRTQDGVTRILYWVSHAVFCDGRLPTCEAIVIDDAVLLAETFFTWLARNDSVVKLTRMILVGSFPVNDTHATAAFSKAGISLLEVTERPSS
jgi:hypothetical protein